MMTMAGLPQTRQAVPPGARLRHAAAPAQQRAHHAPACFHNDPGMDNVYIYIIDVKLCMRNFIFKLSATDVIVPGSL